MKREFDRQRCDVDRRAGSVGTTSGGGDALRSGKNGFGGVATQSNHPSSMDHKTQAEDPALAAELRTLETLGLEDLRKRYFALKGSPLPKHLRRSFALLVVSHAAREKALGGLSRDAQKRLNQLVAQIVPSGDTPPPRQIARKVKVGTRLLREWRGEVHEVVVEREGFIWKGERRRSLSDIARAITGTRWNGWTFFGVGERSQKAQPVSRSSGDCAAAETLMRRNRSRKPASNAERANA